MTEANSVWSSAVRLRVGAYPPLEWAHETSAHQRRRSESGRQVGREGDCVPGSNPGRVTRETDDCMRGIN